jgi:hypothetical protein
VNKADTGTQITKGHWSDSSRIAAVEALIAEIGV